MTDIPVHDDFEDIYIDDDAFVDDSVESLPAPVWKGDGENGGFWVLPVESLNGWEPKDWQRASVRLGNDRSKPKVDCFVTRRLRGVLFPPRERQIVEAPNGELHYYPKWTKKEKWIVGGKFRKSWIQARMEITGITPDGEEEPMMVVLGMKGMNRGMSWGNGYRNKLDDRYPVGVVAQLEDYVNRINRQQRAKNKRWKNLPTFCTIIVDLVPHTENGKIVWSEFGKGSETSQINMFTIDLTTGTDETLPSRWVGVGRFQRLQDYAKNVIIAWQNEWKEVSKATPSQAEPDLEPVPEDDIPF